MNLKSKIVFVGGAACLAISLVVSVFAQTFSSISVKDGSLGSPSITFLSDSTAGFYRSTTGVVSVGTNMSLPNVSASVTPASQAANTCAPQSFTVSGIAAGDRVILVSSPATGNATGYGTAQPTAANTIAQTVCNPTAAAATPAAGTFVYLVIKAQ